MIIMCLYPYNNDLSGINVIIIRKGKAVLPKLGTFYKLPDRKEDSLFFIGSIDRYRHIKYKVYIF